MPKYDVVKVVKTYYSASVTASTDEEAADLVYELDAEDWTEFDSDTTSLDINKAGGNNG